MKIAFFGAKDYDPIWFGKTTEEYGFEVQYIDELYSLDSLNKIENIDVICIEERSGFMPEEIRLMKYKGIKGIIFMVDNEEMGGRKGVLRDIPVVTVARFSPREVVSK